MHIAIAVAIGLVAGVISGVLGVGGGTISIPAMVLLLGIEQHTAQGVSLAAMMFTALVGAFTHYRQGNVKLSVVFLIIPSAVAFSYLGAWAAVHVNAEWLTRAFAIFLLLIGCRMLLFNRGDQGVSIS
jgi:uncharacterized membrane protein YfcA